MIPLYFETKPGGVPLLSDRDIERDTVALIRDFNPSLLSDPAPVDIERFAESYLQLSCVCQLKSVANAHQKV